MVLKLALLRHLGRHLACWPPLPPLPRFIA
jgi:hypothetical protein